MCREQNEPQPIVVSPEVWLDVCKYIMREYADEKDLTTDQIPKVHLRDFVNFCNERGLPSRDGEILCNGIKNLTPEMLEVISETLQGDTWDAAAVLGRIWIGVILANQPPIRNQPLGTHLSLTLTFQDETVLQLAAQTNWNPLRPATNGFLIILFQAQMFSLFDLVARVGLDELHNKYAQPLQERLGGTIKKIDLAGGQDKPCDGSS